ncbi:Glutaminase [Alkaliphilus metalliredigens QYMF]|uniref:Glutaminase n=1 Tax=Alkaliphilus metalliredigens (strain QYMF) TaxID=293826 RepID=GLSA_ALKMQ|nr:glutaminase A [Alkaliphilus metalliredigens]A6TU96.1 RecName: Full=Glutaminase [Alkaliphilus metalliredigens QYMF]ABR49764.1 Glutaminase [Alkaliphilus metalliredigens QYMF]
MNEQLQKILDTNRHHIQGGQLPTYIPELSKANKEALGIYVADLDGNEYGVGDYEYPFTIQSISKVVTLLLALSDRGEKYVFDKVGMEPTGDPFNSMMKLEVVRPSKPFNPMINAGAIAVTSMIKGDSQKERLERILGFFRQLTENPNLQVNQSVYRSEKITGDRNRSMAYFMKDVGIMQNDIESDLDLYFNQCSIEVTCKDIAKIGRFLANGGVLFETGQQLIDEKYIKMAEAFMVTCGMYNASGEFAIKVGIPAKSGVGGGIMASVPKKMGIGVVGPSLDEKGNSIAGVRVLQKMAEDYGLSIF